MATNTNLPYDHPNHIVRREMAKTSTAGATAVLRFAHYQAIRVKAVHFVAITAGTSDTGVQVIVAGTQTTTSTNGTATAGSTRTVLFGTANNPTGVAHSALTAITITNAVDATAVYEAIVEYEVTPGATYTA